MGVIIKYQVHFRETGLIVSNAPLPGAFLIDASIEAGMFGTSRGGRFEMKLFDLPQKKAKALLDRLTERAPLHAAIKLGYSDLGPFSSVMQCVVESVRGVVEESKLVTIVRGRETATYVLQQARYERTLPANSDIAAAMRAIVGNLRPPAGESAPTVQIGPGVSGTLPQRTLRGRNAAIALQELATMARAEMLIVDGEVVIGKPIRVDKGGTRAFKRQKNLASFEAFSETIPGETDRNALKPVAAAAAHGFTFVVTGDPALRPGHRVTADLDGFESGEFRIHSLVHKLSVTEGYACRGRAIKVPSTGNDQRVQRNAQLPTADSIIDGLSQITGENRRQRPTIQIGKVKQHSPGTAAIATHRANLYYGQTYESVETQPSVRAEVETKEDQVANEKPIVSPFAWHKCGLVTPVYPGMKAVLAHNLNLDDDSLVTGFIWSELPAIDPPASEAGDWWLCLPTDYTGDAPPTSSTKAANDLTANNGNRIVEVKGLKIVVGGTKLRPVGERPAVGNDDELLIEHKKARITVAADGAIEIVADADAGRGKVTIAPSGDVELSSGSVSLKVGSGGVQIS